MNPGPLLCKVSRFFGFSRFAQFFHFCWPYGTTCAEALTAAWPSTESLPLLAPVEGLAAKDPPSVFQK